MLRITVAGGTVLNLFNITQFLPDVILTVAAYYYATRPPLKMEAFRSWVRKRQHQDLIRLDAVTTQNLLGEMDTDAIGIGKGVFHVNAELIAKLSSSVGTFFLVIAPSSRK
ncbi:unnamed protein product [Orchesella dallaii]|uniref:Uncharacterized protein n=1 Tax=Orchesella dallaii TaxID=48710 RepID=A0ABP1RYB9_9HEXA